MARYYRRRPARIDIFVDGSWLSRGRLNPVEAGGWGALVVETYAGGGTSSWTPAGVTPEHVSSSNGAEIHAAVAALEAVRLREEHRPGKGPPPQLVLHTDQKCWTPYIDRVRQSGSGGREDMDRLARLLIAMGATVEYARHDKSGHARSGGDPRMAVPHAFASRQAWKARLTKQDGVLHIGPTRVELPPDTDPDRFVSRIFPVNPDGYER